MHIIYNIIYNSDLKKQFYRNNSPKVLKRNSLFDIDYSRIYLVGLV